MISLGLLELNSIARGVEAGDAMLKAAEVTLLKAGSVCPGKYTVVISGEVAAVKAAMDAGRALARDCLVDDLTIASLEPQVIPAIAGCAQTRGVQALGVMEFYSIAASVVGADAAAKAARDSGNENYANTIFLGFNGDRAACEAILNDELTMSVAQMAYEMGYMSVEAMVQALDGEEIEPNIDSGSEVVTPDNAQTRLDTLDEQLGA